MTNLVVFTAVLASVVINCQLISSRPPGDPILIVPGLTGSRLSVRHSGISLCNTFGKSVGLWVNEMRLIFKFGCFSSELMLEYDRSTDQYSSTSDRISVSVPGFGDTYTVETLSDPGFITLPAYDKFVEYFVKRGYQRGKSIRAAPYDWRVGPEELQRRGYYDDLKDLIETMCRENGNRKVAIVAHSMGAPVILYLLTQSGVVTQAWKDQYIGNFIPISGAWAGGNKALEVLISGLSSIYRGPGDIFNLFLRLQDFIMAPFTPIIRSFQSIYFLLPHPSVWENTILVSTPTQSYTASDYEQLFSDIGLTDGYAKYQGVENINKNFPSPNVPTHCLYGVGVDTPERFHYTKPFPKGANEDPEVIMGDGDGDVSTNSSEVCLRWAHNNGGHSFKSMTFDRVDHLAIISNEDVLGEIGSIVGVSIK